MPTAKKKSSSKKASAKKAATKKKVVTKKGAAVKKAATKKTAPKKKAAAKKATPKKKTVAKKAAPKKKVAAKKAAPKKKVAAKKAAPKKKVAAKKAVAKKATAKTKSVAKPDKKQSTKKPEKAVVKTAKKAKKKVPYKSKGTLATAVKNPAGHSTPVEGFATYKMMSNEEYMNDEQIQHFRDLLRAWKMELMQEVDRTVHHMQDEAANFPDPNDRATQESEFSLELRTRDRERKLIKKIDESFALLDTGEYGYCESCGIEIGVRRLEARPTATQCIDCKTLDEIREKQRG